MQAFKSRDIVASIDEVINSDPLIERIKLDATETLDFLDRIPELYHSGSLKFNSFIDRTEYIYRHVVIQTEPNCRLVLG